MKILKKIVKAINNAFISLVLFVFYFLVIGLAFIIYHLFHLRQKKPKSYWQDVKEREPDIKYFESPY